MAQKQITVCECDRCGKEEEFVRMGGRKRPENWTEVKGKDLCPDCDTAYNDWFAMGKAMKV